LPTYQSYLIVKKDSRFNSLEDLRGTDFAFTDPESNSGSLVPRFWIAELGESPATFFRQTIYTYSHDNSIKAVSKGLVDAAAVDGHKWEYYQAVNPGLTEATRIIKKSEPFGSPPLVVAARLSPGKKKLIQTIVTSMHHEKDGQQILKRLMIDRFVLPEESWYASVKNMYEVLQTGGNDAHTAAKSQ
jgi:phosphonate transport system substrate-binding protein